MTASHTILIATGLVLATGPVLATSSAAPPTSPPVRTFSNVTAATLACMADRSRKQHGTVYTRDAKNPNVVTSETHYFGSTRIVDVADAATGAVTYTILQKPAIASYDRIWDGIRDAIRACSSARSSAGAGRG